MTPTETWVRLYDMAALFHSGPCLPVALSSLLLGPLSYLVLFTAALGSAPGAQRGQE